MIHTLKQWALFLSVAAGCTIAALIGLMLTACAFIFAACIRYLFLIIALLITFFIASSLGWI